MATRTLELTLISAKDLKEVNLLSKMEVYAVVSLSGDPRSRQRVQPDRTGGRNPTWNATLRFNVPASGAGSLHVLLRAERALGDRDVGEVHIPLSELLSGAPDGPVPAKFVAYQVRKISSGKAQGVLNFSYKLGEVTQSAGGYAHSPAQSAYTQTPPAAAYNQRPSAYPPAGKAEAYPAALSVAPPSSRRRRVALPSSCRPLPTARASKALHAAAAPAAGAVDEETPAASPPSDPSKGVENLVIIGSGPAGYTAAIYAARANLKPVVFEGYQVGGVPGGQLMTTTEVENFPGFPEGITGPDLMDRMRKQAERWGAELHQEDVEFVNVKSSPFVIRSSDREVKCHSLIIATGAAAKRLRLPREDEFWSRGISACAICDGASPLFKGQVLAVVGGGDTATEEAIYLTKYARHVHLLVRKDQLRASRAMQDRVLNNPNITVHFNTETVDVVSNDKGQMSGIQLKRTDTGEESVLEVKGLFYGIGHTPNSQLLQGQIELDSAGYILVKEGSAKTSVDGVFAAGDVQDHEWRQAVTAAGSGCIAALSVERYLVANDLLIEFHQPVQEETKKDITDKDVEMGFDISHTKHKGQYALRKIYHESPRLICVLYTSPTCGPCRTLKPILSKVIDEYDEYVHFVEIDIEEDPEIAEAAGIMGTPCVQFFKNKEMIRTVAGVKMKKEYREFIESNK